MKGEIMSDQEVGTEKDQASETEQKVGYISSSELIDRVHQFGGRTRDIVDPATIQRINTLQEGVRQHHIDLSAEEWNELMGLKAQANAKYEAWLEARMAGNETEDKLPYVETTPTFERLHKMGGHTSEICNKGDLSIYNELQPRLQSLSVDDWNKLMRTKQSMLDAVNAWILIKEEAS
jgi:hypothetical protein